MSALAHEDHRFTLRLSDDLYAALCAEAGRTKLGLAATGRLLLQRALEAPAPAAREESVAQVQVVALSALVASEQVLLFLSRRFPDGERLVVELGQAAADNAEARLEKVRQGLVKEEDR